MSAWAKYEKAKYPWTYGMSSMYESIVIFKTLKKFLSQNRIDVWKLLCFNSSLPPMWTRNMYYVNNIMFYVENIVEHIKSVLTTKTNLLEQFRENHRSIWSLTITISDIRNPRMLQPEYR